MPERNDFPEFIKWFNELKDSNNKARIRIGLLWLMKIEKENLPMNILFNGSGEHAITCSSSKIPGTVLDKLIGEDFK